MIPFALHLYPELRDVAPEDRDTALARARGAALDAVELLGIATGLIVAMLVLRYAVAGVSLPLAAHLAAAIGVFTLTVVPFMLRRTRRGLRALLSR